MKYSLEGRNIFCLSNPAWEGDYAKTIVEIVSVMGRSNKLLYLEYQFTVKDLLSALLGNKEIPWKRMLGLAPRLRKMELEESSIVYVLTPPPILSINFLPQGRLHTRLNNFNAAIIRYSSKRALKKLKMNKELILIDAFNPSMGLPNVSKFNEKLHIYHCYDEIGASAWVGDHGARLEEEYMPKVDAIICTSKGLQRNKSKFNKECFFVPNGVNYNLFHQAFPEDYTGPKKQIAYIGSIDDRLDYDLLDHLFKRLADCEFKFVGRLNYDKAQVILSAYPNVEILPPRSVNELPELMKNYDVGLIPFVKNEFTKGVYPLKINEYLAAGMAVVMTDFADLQDFHKSCRIHNDPEEFTLAVEQYIKEDDFEQKLNRASIAAQNSWEYRTEAIYKIINKLES